MTQTVPTMQDFESLFINNTSLDEIRAHVARFNPIKTMGMAHMEIRHSAILGWLLDPQQTHGLGDRFLRAFLSEALRGSDGQQTPRALEIAQADLMDAEVRREWRHIDLLVISPANGWVFVIENKFYSGQHSDQLTRYMDLVEKTFLDNKTIFHARGIFLSLADEEPDDPRYTPTQYGDVCGLISQCAFGSGQVLAPQIETFIRHYLEVIEEATGMSETEREMEKLARELYRDHKRVLDYVIEQGKTTEFGFACETFLGDVPPEYPQEFRLGNQTLVFNGVDNAAISFLPKRWFDAFGGDTHWWHGVENWWAGFPLITWLRLTPHTDGKKGQITLYAEVGPLSDHAFRTNLIEAIANTRKQDPTLKIGFQAGATKEGKQYSKFQKKVSAVVSDIHDHESIALAMTQAIGRFSEEIDAVAKILPQFIAHGKKESSQ